ncbi:MAG: hypothetical protein IT376_10305 [Polyangiaceae bacterium]|nr:hypothetical protein [Polyangiaceae bacterium]
MTRRALAPLALPVLIACAPAPAREPGRAAPGRLDATPGMVLGGACTTSGPERCFDARDDNCNGLIDDGCGLPTGYLQFAVAWAEEAADVELEVTDPNGELAEVGRATASGLVKQRDCPGESRECHGQNLENVYLEAGDPPRGRYSVRVRLERLGGAEPPIRATIGARIGPKSHQAAVELTAEGASETLSLVL